MSDFERGFWWGFSWSAFVCFVFAIFMTAVANADELVDDDFGFVFLSTGFGDPDFTDVSVAGETGYLHKHPAEMGWALGFGGGVSFKSDDEGYFYLRPIQLELWPDTDVYATSLIGVAWSDRKREPIVNGTTGQIVGYTGSSHTGTIAGGGLKWMPQWMPWSFQIDYDSKRALTVGVGVRW